MSTSVANHKLPSTIEVKLRSVRLRHALLAAAHALAIGSSVFIVLMILSMAIDWVFPFMDPAVRLFLSTGTVIVTVALVAAVGLNPIRNSLRWSRAASAVDDEIPQLQERWSTVASLASGDQANETPTARAMAQQVTSEAIAMGKIVHPGRVAPPTSLRPALLAAACSALVLAGLVIISPAQLAVLLQRFWSPTSTITATQLTSLTGDQLVPRGDQIELVTKLSGLPRSGATLTVRDSQGVEQSYQLRPHEESPGQFVHKMRMDESLTYRVRSGDGQTGWHSLQVIDFPEIDEVQFSIHFPHYTNRQSVQRDLIPRRVKVIQGSTLELAIKPIEPLQRLSISLTAPELSSRFPDSNDEDTSESSQDLVAGEDGWYRFRMQLLDDVLLRPTLWSPHGLKNQRRLFSRIEVIADKAPVARVVSPTDEMAVAVDDKIEIEFEAHDDHGIATAELVVYDESQTDADGNRKVLDVKEIPLGDQRLQKHVMGKTQLDLKQLNLAEGSEISYAIRVTDNRSVPSSQDGITEPATATQSASEQEEKIAAQQNTDKASSEAGDPNQKSVANSEAASSEAREPSDREAKKAERPGSDPTHDALAEMLQISPKRSDAKPNTASTEETRPRSASDGSDRTAPMKSTPDVAKRATNDSTSSRTQNEPETSNDSVSAKNEDGRKNRDEASHGNQPKSETPKSETVAKAIADDKSAADAESTAANDNRSNKTQGTGNTAKANGDKKSSAETNAAKNRKPAADRPDQTEDNLRITRQNRRSSSAASNLAGLSRKNSANQTSQPPPKYLLSLQTNRSGQNTLTGRRRLRITARLAAIAKAEPRPQEDRQIRESVVAIDEMLAEVEAGLKQLVDHEIADADRAEQFRRIDTGLGNVESYVADLRDQTKVNQFAFIGLQMVDITRTHVTPARDRVFAAVQRPNASDADATVSLEHIVRARELLGALLKRYDRVVQEQKLKRSLDETVTMYEVYIEKRRLLMRETRQNLNPLQRKLAVIEVDQEYLDRVAEVLELRREMLDEFAQMLGDDPRLLSRYMELIKRRRKSLRDRMSELSQRQYEATEEMLGWLQIDETQKQDLWTIIAELRLHSASQLARDAAELAERIEKQMPLGVDAQVGIPAELIRQARQIASAARRISFDAEKVIGDAARVTDPSELLGHAQSLIAKFDRLDTTLDRLQFEHEDDVAITDYVEPRMLETRTVADQADAWAILCECLADGSYSDLVAVEQYRMALAMQLLRVEMLEIESDLEAQFQRLFESSVPDELANMVRQLHRLMESITFNQAAASFRAGKGQLDSAAQQQQFATDRFDQAEQLFDQIRRGIVQKIDEYDPNDPNIADLRDPTLDEFLARLEREPSFGAQLGIPCRPSNLRVIADSILWQRQCSAMLGGSGQAAMGRAGEAMKMRRGGKKEEKEKPDNEMSDEQREKLAEAKKAQEMLEKSLTEIEKQRDDPNTPDGQRRRLKKLAENVKQMIDQTQGESSDRQTWQRIAQADQAKAILQALGNGEAIPDEQWNKLLSTLDDGLWQVRGKQPPEAYRKAIEQYQDQIRELMQTIDEE